MSPAWVFPGRRGSDQKQANIIFEWATCGQSLSSADDWRCCLSIRVCGRTDRDGGEQLKGASEFSHLGDLLTEEQWQMMKPKKKG